jgi:hypothetical protein
LRAILYEKYKIGGIHENCLLEIAAFAFAKPQKNPLLCAAGFLLVVFQLLLQEANSW